MAHPIRKHYEAGSPGHARREIGMTLTAIKREIAASNTPTKTRRGFQKLGLLAA